MEQTGDDNSDRQNRTEGTNPTDGDTERIAGEWAERISRWVLRTGARAKEEAEDIWAEAQEIRRNL